MTLPPRPEMPELIVSRTPGPDGYHTIFPLRRRFTREEAEYAVSLVNAAPAIEAELSALREARRVAQEGTIDELRALVREAIEQTQAMDYIVSGPEYEKWLEKARAAIGSPGGTCIHCGKERDKHVFSAEMVQFMGGVAPKCGGTLDGFTTGQAGGGG